MIEAKVGHLYRHKKTGGIYMVTGFCMIEETWEKGIIYVPYPNPNAMLPIVRKQTIFEDGRFELAKEVPDVKEIARS